MQPNELRLRALRDKVEARLEALLPADSGLGEAMRYSLLAGGKRLRPVLALEFCRVCGGEPEAMLDAACGLEMLHTYSLIHDDLPCMDNDDLRRGKPTNHKVFGEWQALLAGDALQAEAFRAILSCSGLPDRARAEAAAVLAEAAGISGICGGQYLDLAGEGRRLGEAEIREMYARKTGALFRAACRMGCCAASAPAEKLAAAGTYGDALGLSFQLRDDLLDLESTEEALGKPIGSDDRNEKSTLVSCLGREAAEALLLSSSREAETVLERDFDGDPFLLWLTRSLTTRKN
ncbi:MAG: polyprenyl synthetase family protein [Oscillospiraceae bacterium]|nr:polyprenyl synthetase family protein [Oscillospiraceae bacterium]MBR3556669.1 polyprenyl synthetase family protein [Oscillospiraceae bacterium]